MEQSEDCMSEMSNIQLQRSQEGKPLIFDVEREGEGYDLNPSLHSQVLVVDDDRMNIEVMQAMLGQLGIPSDCAMNGEMAVKLITERISLCEKEEATMYKIVLLDYSMPDMDGP